MISVCMATYNGENYIEKQLESILFQTKQPDEVIICDDGSTDATVFLIRQFLVKNQLEDSWKVYENDTNKGYPGNFYYAMGLCKGDYVFLSDQDDIWAAEKLELMSDILKKEEAIQVLCCKLSLIDEQGDQIRGLMAGTAKKGSGKVTNITLGEVFRKTQWQGMVMGYKRAWYQENCKASYTVPHDFLIAVRAAEEEGLAQLDLVLAYHRRHDHNVGKEEHRVGQLLQKQRKLTEIQDYIDMLRDILEQEAVLTKKGRQEVLVKKNSMEDRQKSLLSGKWSSVLKNAKKNKGQIRMATLLCDLWIVKKK